MTQLLNTAHGLLFRSRIRVREVNNVHSPNHSTLHKTPVQIFRVCKAAFPSKKKAVFVKSSQRPRTRFVRKRQSNTQNDVCYIVERIVRHNWSNCALKLISRPTEILNVLPTLQMTITVFTRLFCCQTHSDYGLPKMSLKLAV